MWTIEKQIARVGNRPAGFDYLRLSLSIMIIVYHSVAVCYGRDAEIPLWTGWHRPFVYFMVPSFFALSGFLVAGSLERNAIPAFISLRALRIFPALSVEVFVSAFIIGPLVTSIGLFDYFSSAEFFQYFRNLVGDIQYHLPGVFIDQPMDVVNSQLWTVPFELECYLVIVGLALVGFVRRPYWLLAVTIGLILALIAKASFIGPIWQFAMPGRGLMACFLLGVSSYRLRTVIPYSPFLLIVSLVSYCVFCSFNSMLPLTTLPVAYMTMFLGLQDPPRFSLVEGADYSYGMYLYGYPIQQSVYYFFPQFRNPYFNTAVSLVLAGLLAYLSWTFIESKLLDRKKAVVSFVSSVRWPRFLQRNPSQV
jgi:peptidoglycan/LPS O-acetylase OafA/YrhL